MARALIEQLKDARQQGLVDVAKLILKADTLERSLYDTLLGNVKF